MRPRTASTLFLAALLLPLPVGMAQGDPDVVGPDADGAYLLRYHVVRAAAGAAQLALDVLRSDADGDVRASRTLGTQQLLEGTNVVEVGFLPSEGRGRYTVTLLVDGVASGERVLEVDDAGGSTSVAFDVPDEPTYLNLTADDVNAANKTKLPGEALLTRARLADANGLDDVHAVLWRVEGASFSEGGALLPATDLELRYERSPIPAGDYTLTLRAVRGETTLATAARTFRIREVAPTFVSGAIGDVLADENRSLATTVVLADRNGFPAGVMEARVYRGSARVEGAGFAARLGEPSALPDAEGAARAAFPLALTVPERASTGLYRVSLYADGALVAALPFQVTELPTLASVEARAEGRALVLVVRGAGNGTIHAELDGIRASAPFENGSATLALEPRRRGEALPWTVALHGRAEGPALATRNGSWTAPADGPALQLEALHARRLPAAWRVTGADELASGNATFSFTRWDGAPEPRLSARLAGDRVRVEGPSDLPAGRYGARLTVAWPNGTTSEVAWTFEAGPWVQLSLGTPVVEGRIARVPVLNEGGLAVRRIVVETQPAANVTLEIGNATLQPAASGARAAFSGFTLAPGEAGQLRVELPAGPRASGRHDVQLRVLARVELR